MSNHLKQYLTIVTWPGEMTRQELADQLQTDAGFDVRTVHLQLGRTPPFILGHYDPRQCLAAIRCILNRGGDAFACSLDDIETLGGTHKIKHLELKHGTLFADLWRGGVVPIEPSSIQILIRAKLSEQQTKAPPTPTGLSGELGHHRTSYAIARHRGTGLGFALGGAYGLALSIRSHQSLADYAFEKTLKVSDKLDIHLTDGTVYQIDGDKFGFQILGDQRGLTDNENIDKMCELLAHLAPGGIVDPYFSMWKPPPGHKRLRLPLMKINKDDPAFAFYSRWAALMYRHVMG